MNLYAVPLTITIVAWAADEEDAKRIARTFEKDERRHAVVGEVTRVIDAEKLPDGWDAGCLPYGREDDTTIGMIIGYPGGVADPGDCCPDCNQPVCPPGCPSRLP